MNRRCRTPLVLLLLLGCGVLQAQERVPVERVFPAERVMLSTAALAPAVTQVRRDPCSPGSSEPVTVMLTAQAGTDSIDDAGVQVCYSVDGGPVQCITATLISMNGDYSATIPAQASEALVTYWVTVPDLEGQTGMSPTDTSKFKYFYRVLDRAPHIADVQYTPNLLGTSGYTGCVVTVTGIVTADTSDVPGNPDVFGSQPLVFIQEGTGPWSGIALNSRAMNGDVLPDVAGLHRGDSVTVTGTVWEEGGMTLLRNVSTVTKLGTGTLPSPYILSTDSIRRGDNDGMPNRAEQWEGVLICYGNVVTAGMADSLHGVFYTSNAGTVGDQNTWTPVTLGYSRTGYTTLPPDLGETQIKVGETRMEAIIGILGQLLTRYTLIPRNHADFMNLSGVERENALAGLRVRLMPNVGREKITLEVGSDGPQILTVMIFDALGREVNTPAVEQQTSVGAGVTQIAIDAAALVPGTYRVFVRTKEGSVTLPLTVTK